MEVKIKYLGGMKFLAESRGHTIIIGQPREKGGSDEGMNPLEVFLTALASCTGVYAKMYCQNAGIDPKDLEVNISSQLSKEAPYKFNDIEIKISVGQDIGDRKQALLSFAGNCPVGNTIKSNPNIKVII